MGSSFSPSLQFLGLNLLNSFALSEVFATEGAKGGGRFSLPSVLSSSHVSHLAHAMVHAWPIEGELSLLLWGKNLPDLKPEIPALVLDFRL